MKEKQEYYFVPLEDILERIDECLERRKVIKSFIQEYAEEDKAWKTNLMTVLCEYYSASCRYTEIMNDLILTPPSMDEDTDEEVISVEFQKYALLTSYSKLMIVDEAELKYMHKIHLFVQ